MLERLIRWKSTAVRRLGANLLHTLTFAMLGAMTGILSEVPNWARRFDRIGADAFFIDLRGEVAEALTATLLLTVVLRLCTERASDLIRRPLSFVVILVFSTAATTLIANSVEDLVLLGHVRNAFARPDSIFEAWLNVMLWFGLIGWLYLLSLQRAEYRATLSGLLGKRAALGRQLAKARLGTARAQIDPAEVARVLGEVRARYRDDPPAASALLDELIGRLRRAMSRVRRDPQGKVGALDELENRSERDVADQVVS